MKKSLFLMAAASALMLTACTSEDDVLQSSAPQKAEAKAVGFDVYLPQAVTRAGDPAGVMTTAKLKFADKGFGVFAFHHDNTNYAGGAIAPNFMYNEHVYWTNAGGWTYSPLKYWPNETVIDSQDPSASSTSSRIDRVSFFAYAPYVSTGTNGTFNTSGSSYMIANSWHASETSGIMAISDQTVAGDPKVEWKYTTDLDKNIDLLWGVAPAGMAYQSVNPTPSTDPGYVNVPVGMPLLDMLKPNKDQKMKFLFQHALSRIGLSVVSAIDQIAAGDDGKKFTTAQTRVLIKSVEVFGDFGMQGVLNLNNTASNTAKWDNIEKNTVNGTKVFEITPDNGNLARSLCYDADQITAVGTDITNWGFVNTGVLPSETTLLEPGVDLGRKVSETASTPTYAFGTVLYKENGGSYTKATVTSANATGGGFAKDESGNYQQVIAADGTVELDGTKKYFTITATPTTVTTEGGADPTNYWTRSGAEGSYVYTFHSTGHVAKDATYYTISGETELQAAGEKKYASDIYYYEMPRYFMVIPTASTAIKVKINYAVVTKDEKLTGNVANVDNEITKQISVNLESGKSYNLKLILGLTSVKLDATVADWQVADDAEVNLPQNN
jgi:hypothetical protein